MATTFFSISFFLQNGDLFITRRGYATREEAEAYARQQMMSHFYGRYEIAEYQAELVIPS